MRDVTITFVHNLSWEDVRPYAVSLVRSGFSGLKLVFVTPGTLPEVRYNLKRLGFVLVESPAPPVNPEHWDEWGWLRFHYASEYLHGNSEFRYVIWTDARDVVFQSNVSAWLDRSLSPHSIVVAGLSHTIKDCPSYNDLWVRAVSGSDYNRIREFEAVACGTFAGTASAMTRMFEDIDIDCRLCCAYVDPRPHPQGVTDQGMFNVLIRTTPYDTIVRVPWMCEGFSAQWWPAKNNEARTFKNEGFPVFDAEGGTVYVPGTKIPFSIVHLYDRDDAWLEIMRKKYA